MHPVLLVAIAAMTTVSSAEAAPATGKSASKPKYYVPREVEHEAPVVERRASVPVYQAKKRDESPFANLFDQFLGGGTASGGFLNPFITRSPSTSATAVPVVVTVDSSGSTVGPPVTLSSDGSANGPLPTILPSQTVGSSDTSDITFGLSLPTSTEAPSATPLLSLSLGILPSASPTGTAPSATPTSSDPLSLSVGLGPSTSTPAPATTDVSSGGDSASPTETPIISLSIGLTESTTPSSVPTATDGSTSTSDLISVILPTPTGDPSTDSSTSLSLLPTGTSESSDSSGSLTLLPTVTSDLSTTTDSTGSSIATTEATDTSSTITVPTDTFLTASATASTGNSTVTPTDTTATTTSVPTVSATDTTASSTIESLSSTTSAETGLTATSTAATLTSASVVPTTTSQTSVPQSLEPTGTDSATTESVPSSITIASPTSLATVSATSTQVTSTGIPTDIPSKIQPNSGPITPPENSTQIQLAWNASLPYDFVLDNAVSQAQIFKYTNIGLSHALSSRDSNIAVSDIVPYAATKDEPYIHTVVQSFIPDSKVSTLQMMMRNANSALYQQQDASAAALFSMLDPGWPLLGSSSSGGNGASPVSGGNGESSSASSPQSGADPVGGDSGKASSVRGISAGIASGVVAGAALYGTAMFFIAKRYRKRRVTHQRSSSVLSGGRDMRESGEGPNPVTALMRGGRGSGYRSTTPGEGRDSRNSGQSGSARTQYISPPVAAENSLGWN